MKPLEGVTVVEMARVLACPLAGMILAELGARVIKIEQPGAGDETRGYEPFVGEQAEPGHERSAYYYAFNRSKQSITLDLRSAPGQEAVRRLVAEADVVLENFPTGTLARYGLAWADLRAVNPALVYVSCTGFGQTGPYAKRKGYDTVFQAMSGLMSLTGEHGGGPVKPGAPVADMTSGLWIALGVLAMLQGAKAQGKGAYLDFSMLDAQIPLLSLAAARFFALDEVPERMGTEHPGRVPSASFRCADGNYVHITGADQHWQPLCKLLGLDALGQDPRLQANSGRVRHREEVMAALAGACVQMTREQLCQACDAMGVPAGPLKNLDEVMADPHLQARGVISHFEHPHAGRFPAIRLPYRFDGFDDPQPGRPPLLGEHTERILQQLGLASGQPQQQDA
ncbi:MULTISPECIES: CaiB/BaiF CoA-transferase family protein [unclassified Pseudomonas]|uniref:CaiB/BaiF CoA transferase family protein n=1 Tax=unclassified Pseudomonas TaxID=196821 RepID=UPI000BC76836|nr:MULTISPECIES: CoA transferase [unclassified Pseudomonas]PVZ20542.1 crotonobetainyl-CoA:carnitine CoA-transferase CaiB-like acyl-CoA transferase [Pseudomonas sp. URIL14HWK12:I12]PVZ27608.1 crotonobetainyl-CoA:carnitine CoA-transferase CaiB-like acyl-CoA transferase [Pseudomonas sp. URIL14HWK12:I10]PVZ38497.1 crotonobetainyl-CoA:carnitine CoA-transferase CaiB-like acyl-CoA transferase [Pseudomonas sp. URIL14HWK12:I11]SNZ03124.1 Crotonobetainyl-CoA:carnitine CoA-transferase CaiB [Pseudomonas sp